MITGGYGMHCIVIRKPTVLGNVLRELQRAIIRRGRRSRDIVYHTWDNVSGGYQTKSLTYPIQVRR